MIHPILLHNGSLRPAGDLVLTPGQVGTMAGWGIFSTLKVEEGVLFEFERHWSRMTRDAALFRVPFEWEPAALERDKAWRGRVRLAPGRSTRPT